MKPDSPGILFFEPLNRPKRRNTSEQVTKIEMIMSMMMIHVMSFYVSEIRNQLETY
jgi:hypothetical protein